MARVYDIAIDTSDGRRHTVRASGNTRRSATRRAVGRFRREHALGRYSDLRVGPVRFVPKDER